MRVTIRTESLGLEAHLASARAPGESAQKAACGRWTVAPSAPREAAFADA